MERRNIIIVASIGAALAGCGGMKLPDINVTLPPEIQSIIDDATAIVGKVTPLINAAPQIASWIDTAKGYIDALKTGAGDVKTFVSGLVSSLGSVAGGLPSNFGTIASAIETLLPLMGGFVGMRMAARRPTGMSPAQARAVLRS